MPGFLHLPLKHYVHLAWPEEYEVEELAFSINNIDKAMVVAPVFMSPFGFSLKDCKDFHQAKDGDGWVEQSSQPFFFGLLQKVSINLTCRRLHLILCFFHVQTSSFFVREQRH